MSKKIFAFDMDGTILNTNNEIHPDNLKAIKKSKELGYITVLATGRPYSNILIPFNEHGYDVSIFNWMVCNNGAYFYDVNKDSFEYNDFVDQEVIKELINYGEKNNTFFAIHKDGNAFRTSLGNATIKTIDFPEEFTANHEIYEKEKVMKMALEGNVVQASLRGTKENIARGAKYISDKFGDKVAVAIANEVYLDVNPIGVNKLMGLKHIASKYNLSTKDIIAFGDSGNDVKMLEGVGYSYAMGNATKEAKEVANEVIGNNNTNAIAKTILRILDEEN